MKLLATAVFLACVPAFSQTNGCSTGASNLLDGTVQSFGLCLPQVFDGRMKGGWIALNRSGDQGNGEIQCYDPANVVIQNGLLTEILRAESKTCHYYPAGGGTASFAGSFTSAFVQWNTFNFNGGDIQIRAKGPSNPGGTTGTWPALWLLGTNCQYTSKISADNFTFGGAGGIPSLACNWHAAGSEEIDIFEQSSGGNATTSNCSAFLSASTPSSTYTITNSTTNWHVYELQWVSGTSLTWLVDGTVQAGCTITSGQVPNVPMFLQMNIATFSGSTSGGAAPATMEIDWVKVCQPSPCNGNGGNIIFYDDFVTTVNANLVRPASRMARLSAIQQSTKPIMIFRADADRPKKPVKVPKPKIHTGELQ